jgi:hypothetical protein
VESVFGDRSWWIVSSNHWSYDISRALFQKWQSTTYCSSLRRSNFATSGTELCCKNPPQWWRSRVYLAPLRIPLWANPSRKGSSSHTMSEMASDKLNVPRMVRTTAFDFLRKTQKKKYCRYFRVLAVFFLHWDLWDRVPHIFWLKGSAKSTRTLASWPHLITT